MGKDGQHMHISSLEITERTKFNLLRKENFINNVRLVDEKPLFSWIDINVTERCNRKCIFCPRVNEAEYPNQSLHISLEICKKLHVDLSRLGFSGIINLSGYGEPLLHPKICEVIAALKGENWRVEVVTNGDPLNPKFVKELFESGLDYLIVSLYDGPEQVEQFEEMFLSAGRTQEDFLLRDRWHGEDKDYGLKMTNRAGRVVLDDGHRDIKTIDNPCFYLAYSVSVDWNGDVLLCVQDWVKKRKFGSLHSESIDEVWFGKLMSSARRRLLSGDRSASPCNVCDANGCVHGGIHAQKWLK